MDVDCNPTFYWRFIQPHSVAQLLSIWMIENLVNMTFEKDMMEAIVTLFGMISWCSPDSLRVTGLQTRFEGGTVCMRWRSAVHLTERLLCIAEHSVK
jgi:hypothetical protein